MIYPPCESVFYQMNQNLADIDIKKRYQINPRLTNEEVLAIFNSFQIKEGDKLITRVDDETDIEIQQRFDDIIKACMIQANKLPMARLWLRQVPAGIQIECESDTKRMKISSGVFVDGKILIAQEMLKSSICEIAITLVHELAHAVDRHNVGGLLFFPYNAVNDGEKMCYDDISCEMSEAEFLQRCLIEEAEKQALNNQLFFEAGLDNKMYRYNKRLDRAFNKYTKVFENWTPPAEAGVWTVNEINTERQARAYYYAALETMTGYMREFIKPYTQLFYKLPAKMEPVIYGSNLGPIIDFKGIKKLNLSMEELKLTTDVLCAMRINLLYQLLSYTNLMVALKSEWCRQHGKAISNMSSAMHRRVMDTVINQPEARNQLMSPVASVHFEEYTQRIEGRYMGFIRAKELKPRLNPIAVYMRVNKSNVHKSLIDLPESYAIVKELFRYFDSGLHSVLHKYYIQRRMQEVQQIEQKMQASRKQKSRTR